MPVEHPFEADRSRLFREQLSAAGETAPVARPGSIRPPSAERPARSPAASDASNRRQLVNRVAAGIMWLIGLAATWLLFAAFLPDAPIVVSGSAALIAQGLLTWFERPIWQGRPNMLGLAGIAIDTLLNAGGVFPYIRRIGETPPGAMLLDVFGGDTSIRPGVALILSLVLGFLIAAAPEELWRRKD